MTRVPARIRLHKLMARDDQMEHLYRCSFCNYNLACLGCEIGGDAPHHNCCRPNPKHQRVPDRIKQ